MELNSSDKLISCLVLFPFLSHSDTSEINLSGLDVAIPPYRDSHNDQPSLQIKDLGCRCAAILRTDSLVLSVPLIMGKDGDISPQVRLPTERGCRINTNVTMHFVAFHKFLIQQVDLLVISLAETFHILLQVPGLIFIKNQEEQSKLPLYILPGPTGLQGSSPADLQGPDQPTVHILSRRKESSEARTFSPFSMQFFAFQQSFSIPPSNH